MAARIAVLRAKREAKPLGVAPLIADLDYPGTLAALRAAAGMGKGAAFAFAFSPDAAFIALSPASFPLLRLANEPIIYFSFEGHPPTAKALQPFSKYSIIDDQGGKVRVVIPLPADADVRSEDVEADFGARSFTVTVHNLAGGSYVFRVGRTHHKLDPGRCSFLVKKDKLIIRLCHQNADEAFYSLHKVKMIGETPDD